MPDKCVRGDVVDVNLDPAVGSEIRKRRPCVVIQNDVGNKYSPVTIVAAITGAEHISKPYPVGVWTRQGEGGLDKASVVLCNQLRTIDSSRIVGLRGRLETETMRKVDEALKISLHLA